MGKIDALIPVYNCADYISTALKSIQQQTVKDIRIIIVDDGSSDGTGAIVQEAASQDSRIIYHRQENAGIVTAMNTGLAFCHSPFIARMDGDDISYPDRFEKQLAYLEANPACSGIGCRVRHIDEYSKPMGTLSVIKNMALVTPFSLPAIEPYIIHPMLMTRRSALEKLGGYRLVYNAEDSDLYWRLKDLGDLHILDELLGDYRIHANSVSSASIVNGRQQAVWSQLAALSEQRRSQKKPDIEFTPDFVKNIRSRTTLHAILQAATETLSEAETRWLTEATCAKFLCLCYYRPFEPDQGDIHYIAELHKRYPDSGNAKSLHVMKEAEISSALRMLFSGRVKDSLALAGGRGNIPTLLARALFRVGLPEGMKNKIKKILGR